MQNTKLNKKLGAFLAAALLSLAVIPLSACSSQVGTTSSSSNKQSTQQEQQAPVDNQQQGSDQQSAQSEQGSAQQDGNTPPEPPSGTNSDGGTPPEPPDGTNSDGNTPPEPPSGQAPGGDSNGTPPEPPSGSNSNGGTPPEPPSGEANGQGGTPPEMPEGENGQGGPGGAPGGGGPNTTTFDYSGSYSATFTADNTEATSADNLSATEADVNVVLAQNGGTATITGGTLEKSGDDTNGDNCNFYGLNSIVLAVGEGSKAVVSDATLKATSEGSNALFATNSGTVYANNVEINTTAGNSRGLDATYGGTIVANALTVATQGDHCASIATDRGGGNISVANSTLETAGQGSPILYSTGLIEVDNVTGTSSGSQIAGMEGLNTISISNSTLESTNAGKTASDPVANAVIIYQSTSGDAEATTGDAALFQASDSTLESAITSGAFFYSTNTQGKVVLSNTTLDYSSSAAKLLIAQGNNSNNWGSAGKNGATLTFTGLNQQLEGDVEVDTISLVDMYLLEGSQWSGAATITENADGGTALEANLNVNVDATSTWVVTANTTVDNLNVAEGGKLVDADGKSVAVVDESGKELLAGDSSVKVTVKGAYSTTVETGEANELQAASVDRAEFDTTFGTSTTFGQNGSAASDSGAKDSGDAGSFASSNAGTNEASGNPFIDFINWLLGLFGVKN